MPSPNIRQQANTVQADEFTSYNLPDSLSNGSAQDKVIVSPDFFYHLHLSFVVISFQAHYLAQLSWRQWKQLQDLKVCLHYAVHAPLSLASALHLDTNPIYSPQVQIDTPGGVPSLIG